MKHLIKFYTVNLRCHCFIGGLTVRQPFTLTVCGELVCPKHEPEKLSRNGKTDADCPECIKLSKQKKIVCPTCGRQTHGAYKHMAICWNCGSALDKARKISVAKETNEGVWNVQANA